MLEFLQSIDYQLFKLLNTGLQNPVFDLIFPFITEIKHWYPVYIALLIWLFWKGGTKGRTVAVILIVAVIISDQLSSSLIKPMVSRPRPCHSLIDIRLLIDCGPGKSFPSSHAVNNFASATILSYFFKRNWYIFVTIASLVAFSRVYVGVHYPLDVLAGAVIGVGVACSVIVFFRLLNKKLFKIKI